METGKDRLVRALKAENISVVSTAGKQVKLHHGMVIEIEGPTLFKLLDDGHVVAPFADARELAGFIRMDWIHRDLTVK